MADPFSTAAGAVGVISLALQLLGGCIQGFILLSTAQNFGKDASAIICMLNLQEIHLTEWARRAGLLTGDGTLDRRLNQNAVENTLRQLKDLLLGTEKLKEKYGLTLISHLGDSQQTTAHLEAVSVSENEIVSTMISDDTRRQILARAGVTPRQNIFKRLWWAAVDKDKIEKLVTDIRAFIDELRKMLDPWRQDDLLNSNAAIASRLISLNNRFDQLQSLAEALRDEHSKYLAVSAELKALRLGLGGDEQEPTSARQKPERPRRQQLLKKLEPLIHRKLTGFKPLKKNETMGLADYDGQKVFVEKKSINPLLRSKVLPRVENLAALLNLPKDETFRSLSCRGIVEEDNEVFFIFNYPHPDHVEEPRTLLDLFSAKDGIEPPSLTDRIQLAIRIARIIQNFHRAEWLHKSLRSENILFFAPPHDGAPLYADPVLAGFAFARLGSPTEISEQPSADPRRDIYRHPDAMGEPTVSFNAAADAYSLGTLLLEIAEWRALRYLVESVVDVDAAAGVPLALLAKVRPFLLSERGRGGTSKLRTRMGDIYAETCLMCLSREVKITPDMEETSSFGGTPSLVDMVVRRLESCNV